MTNSAGGEIFTLGGVSDTVITGTSGQEVIVNAAGGWIRGSVDLDFGLDGGTGNTVENQDGAVFVAGNSIDLGDGIDASNLFTNAGVFSIGSAGNPNGNLQLSATRVIEGGVQEEDLLAPLSFMLPPEFAPTLADLSLTTVTGNFTQTATGVTIADLAFDRNDQGVPGFDEMDHI